MFWCGLAMFLVGLIVGYVIHALEGTERQRGRTGAEIRAQPFGPPATGTGAPSNPPNRGSGGQKPTPQPLTINLR